MKPSTSGALQRFIAMVVAGMASIVLTGAVARAGEAGDDPSEFSGVIGRTPEESVPDWPVRPAPPEGAPNVIIWLLDDAGYAHLQPYGGHVETPTIQMLADRGLTFTDFHSIPLCSPARAALLAGRNHHSIGMGSHIMSPSGYPGYNGRIPKSAASIPRILQDAGYATFAIGKWDQTLMTEATIAGPFDSWPSGQGFDRFYGFLGGEAHHFYPSLWNDHVPTSPATGDDYFFTTDMADQAIGLISGLRAVYPKKPFFLYWSTGAVHAPHHAPREYIEKYDGAFDLGWDAAREQTLQRQIDAGIVPPGTRLSPRNSLIKAWEEVPDEERRLYARQMAAFAGQLEQADHQFGRIIELLDKLGELENTLIIVTSDNGASAEGGMAGLHNEGLVLNNQTATFESNIRFFDEWGGPNTINHFHAGWAMAGNTPFPFFKHHTDGGGTHVPLIVHWPRSIKSPGIRRQYHHIIDIGPTVLAAAGVDAPETVDGVRQKPFDGTSISYTFADADARSSRNVQYFEVWANRGIYKDGWKAATIHNNIMPWQHAIPGNVEDDVWRLYHVAEDFSESTDLAAQRPDKLAELQRAWEKEAEKFGVFPLDADRQKRLFEQLNKSGRKEPVIEYQRLGAQRIPEAKSPPVKNRSYRIVAHIDSPGGRQVEGVLATSGGITGGYALYVKDGIPVYVHNLYNEELFYVRGSRPLPAGKVELVFSFEKNENDNGGVGTLIVNGEQTGQAEIRETVLGSFSIEDGFDIGVDEGSSVTPEYAPPFSFNADIDRVVFELK